MGLKVLMLVLLVVALAWADSPVRAVLPVLHASTHKTARLLAQLCPDVTITEDGDNLIIEGLSGYVDQVRELLAEFDKPVDQVVLDFRLLAGPAIAERFGTEVNVGPVKVRRFEGPEVEVKCPCGVHLETHGVERLSAPRHAVAPGKQTTVHQWEGLDVTVSVKSWHRGVMELGLVVRAGTDRWEEVITARDGDRWVFTGKLLPASVQWKPQVLLFCARAMR